MRHLNLLASGGFLRAQPCTMPTILTDADLDRRASAHALEPGMSLHSVEPGGVSTSKRNINQRADVHASTVRLKTGRWR
jgi:hypothetical protein